MDEQALVSGSWDLCNTSHPQHGTLENAITWADCQIYLFYLRELEQLGTTNCELTKQVPYKLAPLGVVCSP